MQRARRTPGGRGEGRVVTPAGRLGEQLGVSLGGHRLEQLGSRQGQLVGQLLVDVVGDRADHEVVGQVGDGGCQPFTQHFQVAYLAEDGRVPLELVLERLGLVGVEAPLEGPQCAAQAP